MPNKNYVKGVRKERKLVNQAREAGLIAFRSAGSHSPIDVVIIDMESKKISLVQCKPENFSASKKKQIESALMRLNDEYLVSFEVY